MSRTIKVDLFSDIVCPWCLVGAARLDAAIARLPTDITVMVENHPFFLDPETPPEGEIIAEKLKRKYGRPPEAMWERLVEQARASGIDLDPRKQERSYPTAAAHTIIRHARDGGRQHELANAMAEAYFLDARNISDPEVLAELAAPFGFSRDRVLDLLGNSAEVEVTGREAIWAAQQGITGVPFFIFDGRFGLSGCQPQEIFDRAFAVALSPDAENAAG